MTKAIQREITTKAELQAYIYTKPKMKTLGIQPPTSAMTSLWEDVWGMWQGEPFLGSV